jgi:hypothetical protein
MGNDREIFPIALTRILSHADLITARVSSH